MSVKTNRLCRLAIGLVLVAFIAWSIIAEMPVFVPISGFAVALLLVSLCRRFTKETMVDERIQKINERASAISHRISTILMTTLAITFIATRQTLPYEFEIVGVTLAYSACVIMLIHVAYYYYYKNKL